MAGRKKWTVLWQVWLVVLTACAGNSAPAVSSEGGERSEWQAIPLVDVRTGENFTLADFAGKVVIVEAMAVWCPLCTTQQQMIAAALSELDDQYVVVSLDVDPNEDATILARHAEQQGWSWRFAIAPPEMLRQLQEAFGPQVLAPTSTPVLVIDALGAATLTPAGIKGWEEVVSFARAAGG